MRKRRNAQAALEFLMTYGWAIMVVLIAIGALAYFGVLSPSKVLPRKCVVEAGIACTDFKVQGDSVTLVLRNGKGEDITLSRIAVGSCSAQNLGTLRNGQQKTFVLSGCANAASSFAESINISYAGESGVNHSSKGSVVSPVEGGSGAIFCSDSTAAYSCSSSVPYFCNADLALVETCSTCGCLSGYSCLGNGSCYGACSDSTPANTCSATVPQYCNAALALVDTCSACGCPANQACQGNGSCIWNLNGTWTMTYPGSTGQKTVNISQTGNSATATHIDGFSGQPAGSWAFTISISGSAFSGTANNAPDPTYPILSYSGTITNGGNNIVGNVVYPPTGDVSFPGVRS